MQIPLGGAKPAVYDRPLVEPTSPFVPASARAGLCFEDIDAFDDEALATFLDPTDGGVDPQRLGVAAIGCRNLLVERIARNLPDEAVATFRAAHRSDAKPAKVERARAKVTDQLLWPLVYWTRPDDYVDLTEGELIDDRVFDELELDGAVVCDIGAGAGRFTLPAARRAREVIAVDAVPAMLGLLLDAARRAGRDNITTCRAPFRALPLGEGDIDVAVACSSFTKHGPHGGSAALLEAERVVRPGGLIAVIWPEDPAWFRRHGYRHVRLGGEAVHHFRDVGTAERLCATYYSSDAAAWVRKRGSADVPYSVLGSAPPNDVCLKRID